MGEDTTSETNTASWERLEHGKGDVHNNTCTCSTLNLHCIKMNELHPCQDEIPQNPSHLKKKMTLPVIQPTAYIGHTSNGIKITTRHLFLPPQPNI